MSERLQGWIECRNPASSWFSDEWAPAVDVEALLEDSDDIISQPPFASTLPPDHAGPLVPGKGLPPDVSALVAQEAGRWQVPWTCDALLWPQMQLLRQHENLPAEWRLVLTLMEALAAYCGQENVRLIVWTFITDYS